MQQENREAFLSNLHELASSFTMALSWPELISYGMIISSWL